MKSEQEVREMLVIIRAFGSGQTAERALEWVLGLYPPPPPSVERTQPDVSPKPTEANAVALPDEERV